MNLKKSFAAMTVGVALLGGIALNGNAEASYGVFDVGAMRNKKTEATAKAPDKTNNKKPAVHTINSNARPAFNLVSWSLTGTITREKKAMDNAAIYVVEYNDGTEVPKYHMENNTIVFDNIAKGQLVSCTREGGKYVTMDFKAPSVINVIVFSPSIGIRYFTLEKRNYMGKYDLDFGPLDDTKAAIYHEGIIQ